MGEILTLVALQFGFGNWIDQFFPHQHINATQVSTAGAVAAALIGLAGLLMVRSRAGSKVTE